MTPDEIAQKMDGRLIDLGNGRSEALLPSPVVQNHAAFLSFLPDGSLGCAWFGGSLEGKSDISIRFSRLKPGEDTWSSATTLTDDPAHSEQNPVLFVNDDKIGNDNIRLFHTSQVSGNQEGACVKTRSLTLQGDTISAGPAQTLPLAPGTFVRSAVVRRADGALLLPLFLCRSSQTGAKWNGSHDGAALAISRNDGQSWRVVEVPGSGGCVHMTIVPLEGAQMVAFFRRRQADFVYRSVSEDNGESWSVPQATDVPNNNSSISAIRLKDGRIALLCNPVSAADYADRRASLYDELGEEDGRPDSQGGITPIWGVPRAPLTLCFSSDEGRTFPERIVIEDSDGTCLSNDSTDGRNKELSYPSLLEDKDGSLHMGFTFYRRAIKYVRLKL